MQAPHDAQQRSPRARCQAPHSPGRGTAGPAGRRRGSAGRRKGQGSTWRRRALTPSPQASMPATAARVHDQPRPPVLPPQQRRAPVAAAHGWTAAGRTAARAGPPAPPARCQRRRGPRLQQQGQRGQAGHTWWLSGAEPHALAVRAPAKSPAATHARGARRPPTRLGGVRDGAAQLLLRHLLPRHAAHNLRPRQEHVGGVAHLRAQTAGRRCEWCSGQPAPPQVVPKGSGRCAAARG